MWRQDWFSYFLLLLLFLLLTASSFFSTFSFSFLLISLSSILYPLSLSLSLSLCACVFLSLSVSLIFIFPCYIPWSFMSFEKWKQCKFFFLFYVYVPSTTLPPPTIKSIPRKQNGINLCFFFLFFFLFCFTFFDERKKKLCITTFHIVKKYHLNFQE